MATTTSVAKSTAKKKPTLASKSAAAKKSAAKSAAERRRGYRAPCKMTVDCRDVDIFVSSKIMNISSGGLYVKTRKPPPANTPLDIEFYLPNGQDAVHATGSVRWVNPAASRGNAMLPVGVGIHFDKIQKKDLKRIEDFILKSRKNTNFS